MAMDCPWPWSVHGHGLSIAMDCPWPWTVHGRLLFPLWLCRLVPSFGPLWPAWRPGPPLPARPARNVGTCATQDLQPGALIDAEPGVLMKLGSELSTTQQGKNTSAYLGKHLERILKDAQQVSVRRREKFVLCKQLAPWSWSLSRASVAVVAIVVVIDVS